MGHRNRYASRLSAFFSAAFIILGALFLLLPADAGTQSQRASFGSASLSPDGWARDLDFLAAELPKKHKNLFHNITEGEFQTSIEALKEGLVDLHPHEILAGLLRIVAAVGDSHTTLGYRPRQGLLLMLYWFKDGIYVLNTTGEYKDILYGRIISLGGRPIGEVADALSSVIPHENEAQVKNRLPSLLTDTDLLHGLKLLSSPASSSLTVRTKEGEEIAVEMKPVPFTSQPAWLVDSGDEAGSPLYLKNRRLFYWFETLSESGTLYFKYNSCQNMKEKSFADFVSELFSAADAGSLAKMVIDLRHNGGGNSGIFRPFLEELKKRPRFLKPGNIFVLLGRRTFSSAILNALELKRETPAVLAGEPTGGKPNHYGEVRSFKLPESGLPVTYSVKYFQVVEGDPDSLYPDIAVELSFEEYHQKIDPVLEAVLKENS
jgi:hypothetical protein